MAGESIKVCCRFRKEFDPDVSIFFTFSRLYTRIGNLKLIRLKSNSGTNHGLTTTSYLTRQNKMKCTKKSLGKPSAIL